MTTIGRPPKPGKLRYVAVQIGVLALIVVCAAGLDANWARLLDAPLAAWTYGGLMVRGVVQNPFLEPHADYWLLSLELMGQSLAMAWVGTVIAAILSFPLGFLAASNTAPRWVVIPIRQLLNAIRAVPDVVLAIVVMVPVFGLGPLGGALALGVGSVGTLGKLASEAIEGIQPGPVEAVRASGARSLQVLRWGVLPQVMPEIVAFWLYRFEVNIRAGAILGVVGAGGIGAYIGRAFESRDWDRIGIALFVVILVTMIVDAVSGMARHRVIAGAGTPRVTTPQI
jgi:phosphonate transport system permease protein